MVDVATRSASVWASWPLVCKTRNMLDRKKGVRRPGAPKTPHPKPNPAVRGARGGQTARNRPPATKRERPKPVNRPQTRQEKSVSLKAFAITLTLVIGLLGISQPLHQWWAQQREYKAILYQIEQAKKTNAELQQELDRWSDKSYVASQARARLHYVQPGETQYQVIDPPGGNEGMATAEPVQKEGPPRPWFLVIADTVDAADAPDPVIKLDPTVRIEDEE